MVVLLFNHVLSLVLEGASIHLIILSVRQGNYWKALVPFP